MAFQTAVCVGLKANRVGCENCGETIQCVRHRSSESHASKQNGLVQAIKTAV